MREPGQHDRWTIVGVASAALSGAVAFEIGVKPYVISGFLFGAFLKTLFLTRWRPWETEELFPRETERKDREAQQVRQDWFYVVFWPASFLGIYWVAKKGEAARRERIVREVMES